MLNQTAIYAIRAMGFLAAQEEGIPVLSNTIAEEMEIPKNFLLKIILNSLRKNLELISQNPRFYLWDVVQV